MPQNVQRRKYKDRVKINKIENKNRKKSAKFNLAF